jgi:hypothetical protein
MRLGKVRSMNQEQPKVPPFVEGAAAPPTLAYQQGYLPRVPDGWGEVRTYALKAEGMRRAMGLAVLVQMAVSVPLMGVAGVAWGWVAMAQQSGTERLVVLGLMAAFLAGMLIFKCWRIAWQTRNRWPSFRLVISDKGVLRRCQGFADLVLEFPQITRVMEGRKTLEIRGKRAVEKIAFRKEFIENYEEIRAALAAVRPIETVRHQGLKLAGRIVLILGAVFLSLGVFGWGLWSQNLAVELGCLGALLIYCGWTLWSAWRNPNVPTLQKVSILTVLFFPCILGLKMVAWRLLNWP